MRLLMGILALAAGAAGAAFVFLADDFSPKAKASAAKVETPIDSLIPKTIGSMTSRERPLGNTEEVAHAAESLLNVNEWVNREYSLPDGKKFQLYISHWLPNKEDVVKASTHTPDRCWVKNGWKNDDSKKRFDDVLEGAGGKRTFPAHYREYLFDTPSAKIRRKVWFWFLVDGKPYNYNSTDNFVANPASYAFNAFRDALVGSPEQYFIRIDSDGRLEDFAQNEDFKALIDKLGEIILYPKAEGGLK